MALSKDIKRILLGTSVKTIKQIEWHGLRIPAGTRGVIIRVEGDGESAYIQFDDFQRYGSLVLWFKELGPA
jgi:hypothetical protein